MIKKFAALALLVGIAAAPLSAATQTYTYTGSDGWSSSGFVYVSPPSSAQFSTEGYAWGYISGGSAGVSGLYEIWWDSDPFTVHPSYASASASAPASTYLVYRNVGSNVGGGTYVSTTVTW